MDYSDAASTDTSVEETDENAVLFPATHSVVLLAVTALCGTAAMLSKETGITVFGVCAVYDVFIACRRGIERWTTNLV